MIQWLRMGRRERSTAEHEYRVGRLVWRMRKHPFKLLAPKRKKRVVVQTMVYFGGKRRWIEVPPL